METRQDQLSNTNQTLMTAQQTPILKQSVEQALQTYFQQVKDQRIENIYELVLTEVETSLLSCVMQHTQSNQTRSAKMLGVNRGTLRKKLKKYNMLMSAS